VVEQPRDDELLARLLEAAEDAVLALDFRHASWAGVEGVEGVVRVNDLAARPFRYIRLREPPHTDADLVALAATLEEPAFVYFRHEDAPTAPAYAARLRELLSDVTPPG
jgi:uncharacterized protein YecE (DUF72 family)